MKVLIFALITIGTLSVCQCLETVSRPGKGAEYCQEICSGCGGPSFTENSVCYCYVEKGVDVKKCIDNAWKKSSKYNIDWVPIHPPGRIARKARPVRGSFLDPIVANVFEKHPSPNVDLIDNFLHKSPEKRLFKRSLKKDLSAHQELADMYNYVEQNFYERKRRVPRSLAVTEKKILDSEEESGEFFIKKKLTPNDYYGFSTNRREKRNITPFKTFPKFDVSRPNMYEIVLEYPSSREEDKIQLLFPNTKGMDIEHEYYYDDGSDENDDDFDLTNDEDNGPTSTWNRMSSNYNPLQSLYSRRHIYSTDPDIRDARSLYLLPEQANSFPYPYMMTFCRHT